MKTNSRFHRVVTFTFVAVFAAGISSARAAQAEQRPVTCVQKGLVALYDGIYNSTNAAGVPVHDELARQWVDWTGHTPSFELGGTATNLETAVLFDGDGWATNMNETMKAVIASANGTFEFPYRMDELVYDGKFCHFAYLDSSHRGFTARPGNVSGGAAWGTFACVEYQQSTYKITNLTPSTGVRHTATFTLDSKNCTIYSDGVQLGTSAKGSVAPATSFMGIGRGSPTDKSTTGLVKYTCHGIRVYNRVLSADEIAWNRAYDRMRFDGVSAAEAFTGLTPPDGLAAPDENGVFRARVSIASFTDEPVLSLDNGNTWFATTNGWFKFGTELTVTVREDLRLATKLTGTGIVKQPDGAYVVTVLGPVELMLRADVADQYVTDGLVAFWDVQNNAGTGEFVAETNRWHDSLPGTNTWVLGSSCKFSAATAAMEIPSGASCSFSGTMPTFLTCETCARWDAGERFFSLANSYGGLCFNVMGALASPSEYHANGSRVRVATSGVPDTFAVLCSSMAAGDKGFYRRGIIQGANIGAFAPYGSQNAVGYGLGGIYSQGTASFKGGVYALRLYSRRLSGDELKRNAVLDGSRYLGRALPDGWRIENNHLKVRLSFDLGPDVTVSAGGAQVATDAPVWLNAGTEVTATATPGEGEYAIWNGAPQEATFADGGNTITFTWTSPIF